MTKEKKLVQLERRHEKLNKCWDAIQNSIPMYEAIAPFAIPSLFQNMDEIRIRQRRIQEEMRRCW